MSDYDSYNTYTGTGEESEAISYSDEQANSSGADIVPKAELEGIKQRYGKVYTVHISLEPDDDTELELEYCFVKPKTASYDRYVKTMSKSATKASKAFSLDNIIPEHKDRFVRDLEEYPALALETAAKLLSMLGLSTMTNLTKL